MSYVTLRGTVQSEILGKIPRDSLSQIFFEMTFQTASYNYNSSAEMLKNTPVSNL